MRQIVVSFSCLLLLVLACNQPNTRSNTVRKTKEKLVQRDYKPFLEKFLTDSITQLSSVKFPLKNVIQGENGDVVKFIKLNEWKYTNFGNEKDYIISSQLINEDKFEMLVQMEDTGVYVIYSFERKNGKWILSLIEDAST